MTSHRQNFMKFIFNSNLDISFGCSINYHTYETKEYPDSNTHKSFDQKNPQKGSELRNLSSVPENILAC